MLNTKHRWFWSAMAALFIGAAITGIIVGITFKDTLKIGEWGSFFSAVAAFVAIGFGVVGFLETAEHNRREHKPYLRVDVSAWKGWWEPGSNAYPLDLKITVENYGRTPAMNIHGEITAVAFLSPALSRDGAGNSRVFEFPPFGFEDLPANAPRNVERSPVKADIPENGFTAEEWENFNYDRTAIFVRVTVTYESIYTEMAPETVVRKIKFHRTDYRNNDGRLLVDESVTTFEIEDYW